MTCQRRVVFLGALPQKSHWEEVDFVNSLGEAQINKAELMIIQHRGGCSCCLFHLYVHCIVVIKDSSVTVDDR